MTAQLNGGNCGLARDVTATAATAAAVNTTNM